MEYGFIVQIILIVAGVMMLTMAVTSLARKKLDAVACVRWGFIALIFIIAGIVLRPNGWVEFMSPAGMILLVVIGICVYVGVFGISSAVSGLTRKNHELMMQVSILNHEVEDLQKQIDELEKKLETVSGSEKE